MYHYLLSQYIAMKKLFNKLSVSGKLEADTLREDKDYSDEEHVDTHYRKSSALPADTKDTSQDLKMKKSFSGGTGSVGRNNKDYEFAKQKSSSSGIKKQEKEIKDKEKLNVSTDKALKKSPSRKKSLSKSTEVKDEMRSPALKGVSSPHERRNGSVDSDESDEDIVIRNREESLQDDDFHATSPIRVPSAPARLASSPMFLPTKSSSPSARAVSPRMDSPHAFTAPSSPFTASPPAFTASPPQKAFSPQPQYGLVMSPSQPQFNVASSPPAHLPRSVSSPNPAGARSPQVIAADDFDLRFGGADSGHARTDSNSDNHKTALGNDFARDRADSVPDEAEIPEDDGEATNQKGKGGRFTFGSNKGKKLK